MATVSTPHLAYAPKKSARGLLVVLGMHLLLAWALVSGLAQRMVEVVRAPIETRLIEEVRPPPPPPPPDLPKPTTPPPPMAMQMPVPVVIPQVVPPPQITPPPPPQAAPPPVNPAPVEAIRTPAPAPAPPPATAGRASPEDLYVGGLRAYLNSIKRYPTSREARQLRPQGIVKLKLEIDRSGQLLNVTVEATSGSLLLDNEALRTVRNGRFPAIPPDAFAGQATKTFIVPVEYLHEGG